jgi:hypothetical protein
MQRLRPLAFGNPISAPGHQLPHASADRTTAMQRVLPVDLDLCTRGFDCIPVIAAQ